MFKIEKNIPLVRKKPSRNRTKYPFREMKIGDSFLYPEKTGESKMRKAISLRISAAKYSAKTIKKMKLSIREVKEGVRCWRRK